MTATSNAASFHAEAASQVVCAVCRRGGGFHAHHVIAKQYLKREGLPLWDTRNALRLCVRDHFQFEHAGPGKIDIEMAWLTDENICYAFEALGTDYAPIYLMRHYTGHDRRVTAHVLNGRCELCRS